MNTDEATTAAEGPDLPTFGDELAEFLPWVAAVVVLGPIPLLSLMLLAPFLLLFVPAVAAVGAVSVIGAVVWTPYLLIRHHRQRGAERRERLDANPAAAAQAAGSQ